MVGAGSSVPGRLLSGADRAELAQLLAARVRFDEPLAPRTSMRVGGAAAAFATIDDVATLVALLKYCDARDVAWTILGLGSNVLVRDEGFGGVVLRLAGAFTTIGVQGTIVRAGAAAPIVAVCREAAKHGLGGAEALVGISGPVCGAGARDDWTQVAVGALGGRGEKAQAGLE